MCYASLPVFEILEVVNAGSVLRAGTRLPRPCVPALKHCDIFMAQTSVRQKRLKALLKIYE